MTPATYLLLLVPLLGADSFAARCRAESVLAASLPHSEPVLAWGETHADPEVAHRCTRVMDRWHGETAGLKALRLSRAGCFPWLDMLPRGYPNRENVVGYYLSRTPHTTSGYGGPHWDSYREATRLFLVDRLGSREMDEVQAAKLLDVLWVNGRRWEKDRGTIPPE